MKKTITLIMIMLATVAWSKIPLETFFEPTEFKNMVISPDGKKIAGVLEGEGRDKISILDLVTMKNLLTFEMGESRRVANLGWANNEHIVMNVQKVVGFLDRKGTYDGVFLVKYDGKRREYLYKGDPTSGRSVGILRSALPADPEHILVNMGDGGVKKHNIKSGRSKTIDTPKARGNRFINQMFLGKGHQPRFVSEFDEKGQGYFYYLPENQNKWEQIEVPELKYDARMSALGLSKDPNVAYVIHNFNNPVLGLYKFNLNTGKMKFLYRHDYVDVLPQVLRNLDGELIAAGIMPGYAQTIWLDNDDPRAKLVQSLEASFPNQIATINSSTVDGSKVTVRVRSDLNPGEFYLFDTEKNELKFLAATRPKIKASEMSEMKPFSFKARDGVELHGYITLPKGKDPKNLPLIVNPHGGPHGPRDNWGFNPEIQYLANRGYAVLQVNFRGSGGYGQAFEESGHGRWGREMQDDVTDATLWAVEQGYADKNRLCIYGGSYGGYASLQGVVREPDLYKCAIGYVGVYDMTKFMTCGDGAGQRARTHILTRYIGDDKEIHKQNSPAYNVDKIKADLFIAHGKDDVRVPMCQGNALKNALEKAGKEFKWMVRDEGHGYQKLENRKDFYTAMVDFFEKNIGN